MSIFDLVILILASDAICTAWFYGSIFSGWLDYFDRKREGGSFLGELFTCPMCFAYHAAFWMVLLVFLPATLVDDPWTFVIKIPAYFLAATDVVHFLQKVRPVKDNEPNEEDGNEV